MQGACEEACGWLGGSVSVLVNNAGKERDVREHSLTSLPLQTKVYYVGCGIISR